MLDTIDCMIENITFKSLGDIYSVGYELRDSGGRRVGDKRFCDDNTKALEINSMTIGLRPF
jgi:hypothetical protein